MKRSICCLWESEKYHRKHEKNKADVYQWSAGIIVEGPARFLRPPFASLHVGAVVLWRPLLLVGGAREHREDADGQAGHRQRGRPVVREEREADVAVAVDVVVDGHHRAHERHLRGAHRVVLAEHELQLELLAGVHAARRALDVHQPAAHVVGAVQPHAIRRLGLQGLDLLRQPPRPGRHRGSLSLSLSQSQALDS